MQIVYVAVCVDAFIPTRTGLMCVVLESIGWYMLKDKDRPGVGGTRNCPCVASITIGGRWWELGQLTKGS